MSSPPLGAGPVGEEACLEAGQKLNVLLKDPLFVEYFNAFLALPTFPFKVRYNAGSGDFEEIVSHSRSDVSLITSEVSLVGLSTKNCTTVPLEEVHSKPWVLRERLPLFLRSDLYSEYRLCRLLDQPSGSDPGESTHDEKCDRFEREPTDSPRRGPFGTNGVLELDVYQYCGLPRPDQPVAGGQNGVFHSLEKVKKFRQFLHEKAGEKNWTFWIDSERVHYLSQHLDRAKWIKQLKNKYIRNGSPMQLPAELLLELGITRSSSLNEDHLSSIQASLLEALKSYWYPSFLVHLQCAQQNTHKLHLPQMSYIGPKPTATCGLPRSRSAGQRGSMAVSFRNRSKSISSRGASEVQVHGRPRSYSASEITIKADDFVSKSKQKGRTTPKLKKLKECAWTEEGGSPGKRGFGEVGRRQEVVGRDKKQEVVGKGVTQEVVVEGQKQEVYDKELKRGKESLVLKGKKNGVKLNDPGILEIGKKKRKKNQANQTKKQRDSDHPKVSPSSDPPTAEDYHHLLRYLAFEQWKAGGYFQRYLETTSNQLCLNCLFFWRELQIFKKLFYASSFSPSAVEVKAKELHSAYIVTGAQCDINCSPAVRREIMKNIWPTFEELFDLAEEHVLHVLMEPWRELAEMDGYECERKVEKNEEVPSSTPNQTSSRTGSGRRTAHRKASEGRQWTLLDIISSATESEYFKLFLNANMAAIDLMCWLEIEAFRAIPASDVLLRNVKARQLKTKFLNKKYFFGPNSPASREQQRQVIATQGGGYTSHLPPRPATPVMREAQKFVRSRLDKKWIPAFITQPEFLARNSAFAPGADGPKMVIDPTHPLLAVETQLALKSRDSIVLRKALTDQDYKESFETFLSIQQCEGEKLVNNLHFYAEIQKFKDMYHNHTTLGLLEKKMTAIVTSYLNSASPPAVQVDLTPDVVDGTKKKTRNMGPYVFRDAQACIFQALMSHWTEFMEFVGERPLSEVSFDELKAKRTAEMEVARKTEVMMSRMNEQLKTAVPHFETPDEKKKRRERKLEEKEMGGHIAISFRLSHPEQIITPPPKTSSPKSHPEQIITPPPKTSSPKSHPEQIITPPPKTSSPKSVAGVDCFNDASSTMTSVSGAYTRPTTTASKTPYSRANTLESFRPMSVLSEGLPEPETTSGSVCKVQSKQDLEGVPRTPNKSKLGTPNGSGTRTSPVFMTQVWGVHKQRRVSSSSSSGGGDPKKPSTPQTSAASTPRHTSKQQKQLKDSSAPTTLSSKAKPPAGYKKADNGVLQTYQWKLSSPEHDYRFGSGIDSPSRVACTETSMS